MSTTYPGAARVRLEGELAGSYAQGMRFLVARVAEAAGQSTTEIKQRWRALAMELEGRAREQASRSLGILEVLGLLDRMIELARPPRS
jgi:hypothetical protein